MQDKSFRLRHLIVGSLMILLFNIAACSSDTTTVVSSTGSALPQPSVDCGGQSCID